MAGCPLNRTKRLDLADLLTSDHSLDPFFSPVFPFLSFWLLAELRTFTACTLSVYRLLRSHGHYNAAKQCGEFVFHRPIYSFLILSAERSIAFVYQCAPIAICISQGLGRNKATNRFAYQLRVWILATKQLLWKKTIIKSMLIFWTILL